ncbi:MAG: hypothetical protein ABMA13_06970 [Chthoniobacteraceae bacterium]
MKHLVLALSSSLLLAGCAGVKVIDTQVASSGPAPRAIYIRPFDVAATEYVGHHRGGKGERPIRQALAGRNFAESLKEEMEKMAPAMVIESDEHPPRPDADENGSFWLVEGSLDVVDNGCGPARGAVPFGKLGLGRSRLLMHVRVREIGGSHRSDDKDAGKIGRRGNVIYEFDLAGGSALSGHNGSIYAPGLGDAEPFDFKNAAERVMMALSTDPHRYGVRTSPVIR